MSAMNKRFGVIEIGLFGSYVRNEAGENSDVDLLVKLREPDFLKLAGLLNYIEKLLQKRIDITTKHPALSQRFLKKIEKEIIYA